MSPAAKTPGALDCRVASTRTPLSTSRPAASASAVRGATPTPTSTARAVDRAPAGQADALDAAVALDRVDPRAGQQLDAVLAVDVGVDVRPPPGRARSRAARRGARRCVTSMPSCRAEAATSEPIQPAPITTRRPPAGGHRGQPLAVGDRAQVEDAVEVDAGQRQRARLGAGGEQEAVPGAAASAVGEGHGARRRCRSRPPRRRRRCAARCRAPRRSRPRARRPCRARPRRAGSPWRAAGARRGARPPAPTSTMRPS